MNSQVSSEPRRLDANVTKVTAVCDKHGDYQASVFRMPLSETPITSRCPTCSAEERAAEEARKRENDLRMRQMKVAGLFRGSLIPARFADRTLANYVAETSGQKRAVEICRRFADGFENSHGASMVFCGKPGTGKTHLACGIGRQLIDNLQSVLFSTVLAAIRHIKETYRHGSERSESDAIGDLLTPDLLILDEVGAQLGSEHEKMLMFEVINERYQQCRSTILISNLNADELTAFMGDRVMDRFRESGAVVAFDWASHRGQRAAA